MAKSPRRFRLSFNSVLWLLAGAIAFWLLCWPMVMNVWAGYRWKQIPCHVFAGDRKFSYEMDDKFYSSARRDFWVIKDATEELKEQGVGQTLLSDQNGSCWVSPHDPFSSVLYLDAGTNWTNASGRIAGAGVLLGGALLITFAGRRKSAPPPASPGTLNR